MTRAERRSRTDRKVARRARTCRGTGRHRSHPGRWRKRSPFAHGYSCFLCHPEKFLGRLPARDLRRVDED